MEFDEVVSTRRSIRRFKDEPVPDVYIRKLLEAARLAPSGLNLQPWRFAIVKSKTVREELTRVTLATFATDAPVVLICCADLDVVASLGERVAELQEAGAFSGTRFQGFGAEDFLAGGALNESAIKANLAFQVAIAIEHIALKAVDLGLGTCWVTSFDEKEVKRIVGISDRYSVVAMLPVGYPVEVPGQRPRLAVDDIVI
jgi:nitroreductase